MDEQDEAGPLLPIAEEEGRHLYESPGAVVEGALRRLFGVPPQEAEKLAREILVEYVTRSTMVDDPEECLLAMTGEAGWTWQRRNGIAPPPATGRKIPPELRGLLLLPEALAALPAKVREMVRLRFQENRTYEEIAAEMGVSSFYVKKAVKKAEATLRKIARSGRK